MDFEKLFISDGISDGKLWGTFERKPNGRLRRIKSKFLPMRPTREEAKADLLTWLAMKGAETGDARIAAAITRVREAE